MTIIAALPDHLREVPPPPTSPSDPDGDAKRSAWFAWAEALKQWRAAHRRRMDASPELQALERAKCARDPAYFIAVYGWLFEPRGADSQPFVPFAIQVDLLRFFERCYRTPGGPDASGLVSKTRDIGASWLFCAFCLWGWLFESPFQARVLSRKQDLVDARSPDSLFWKLDYLFNRLPTWMRPRGFDPDRHRFKMHLENPVNGNVIGGDSTTGDAFRSGRATVIGIDEAAHVEDFSYLWSTLPAVADHRFAISSEYIDKDPGFHQLRVGQEIVDRPAIFELDWWHHPEHDADWRLAKQAEMALLPEQFAIEYERDPRAGMPTFVYPKALDILPDPSIVRLPHADLYLGIDPGFYDATALVVVQHDPGTGLVDILDGYMNRSKTADFYASLLLHEPLPDYDYGIEEEDFMDRIRHFGEFRRLFGDTYGKNTLGATMDSFYSKFSEYGLLVNIDRDPNDPKKLASYKNEARHHLGRRAATREILQHTRCADAPGARRVLRALQDYRFQSMDRERVSAPKTPLHNTASHFASAFEFFAVNLRMLMTLHLAPPRRATHARFGTREPATTRFSRASQVVT